MSKPAWCDAPPAGPYSLGSSLVVVCLAEGRPPPSVSWFLQGELWDGEMDPSGGSSGQRRNTLVISPLTRWEEVY